MKYKIRQLVGWVIFVIFLFLLAHYIWNHWEEFSFLGRLNSIYLFPVILTSLALPFLSSYRFFLTIEKLNKPVQFIYVFKFQVLGRFLNRIAPQSGVVYKAHAFGKKLNLGYGPFFSSLISFTWLDLLITVIFCTLLIGAYQPELKFGRFQALEIFMIISVVLLSSTVIAVKAFKKAPSNISSRITPLRGLVVRISAHIRGGLKLVSDSKLVALGALIILKEILVSIIRLYFCFKLIGFSPEFAMLAIFMILSRLSSVIIIAPGNFGIREFLYGYLSDWMGVGMSEGIFISLTLRAIEFILLGCLVCFFAFLDRLNVKKVSPCFNKNKKSIF